RAVSSMDSPLSGVPLGSAQSKGLRRCTRRISTRSPSDRWTTPPADVARAWRSGATPLVGADAGSAEQCPLPARAHAADASHRREAESARLRAERGDGRDRL